MKAAPAAAALAVVLGVLAATAPVPALACEDLFSVLDCSAGSCWSPTANTSFLDSVLLPAGNSASAYFDESSGVLFGGGNVTANLCVPYPNEAWEEFCQEHMNATCTEAVQDPTNVMEFTKVIDYGCSVDAEGPLWFDVVEDSTIVGACNNATIIKRVDACQGTFALASSVLLPPYFCGAGDPPGLTEESDDVAVCDNCTTVWHNLWAQA